ncbi:MAG: hypothetical protein IT324_28610 [Anaerolineae bacterium]|nr:hypothetical protein [Anaerolineae bacterium]
MRLIRYFLLTLIILVAGTGALAYATLIADYPAGQAALLVQSGTATIRRAGDGELVTVEAGASTAVKSGDAIQMDGDGLMAFVGAQTGLTPGTRLEVRRYGTNGSEAQIDLVLQAGQTWQRVTGYSDNRSHYTIGSDSGFATMRSGELVSLIGDSSELQVGLLTGTAAATGRGRTVTLEEATGTIIPPDQQPADPLPWSLVRVLTYRPDGSLVTLPVTLQNARSAARYHFASQQESLVPEGTYNLTVEALQPYQTGDLTLTHDEVNELSVTLSEVVFQTTDIIGNPSPFTALHVRGSGGDSARAVPEGGVLVGPGSWTLITAREEKPNATQPVKVDVAPGQRLVVSIKDNLFGGGTVQTRLTMPDGSTAKPVDVMVYQAGNEARNPLLTFKSDSAPQPLPQGNYVISVRTIIADRREITVDQSQDVVIDVPQGSLTVNYVDAQGKPVPRSVFVYVASAANMQRLGLTIDQMRQTPYGRAMRPGDTLLLPAGTYTVLLDDQKDIGHDNVVVLAGKATTIDLKVAQ